MPSDGSPRILIVRPSALGDVARTVPALVSLRHHFPGARIDWLVAAPYADAIRHHPMLDGVVPFHRDKGLWPAAAAKGLGLLRQLRRARYDLVYDLQGLARSGLFTWATGAPKRVGFANAREAAWLGYTHCHAIDPQIHTVDRMLALLDADGVTPQRDLRLYISDADDAWAHAFVQPHLRGYACIAPTAAWLCKCWPIDRYADIARRLLQRIPRLVILASPSERPSIQPLLDALRDAADRILVPTTTVGQLMALIAHCNILLCNDSAALHIATGFHRPTVAIFGPTNPALVGPYPYSPDDNRVITPPNHPHGDTKSYRNHNDQSLISTITTDTVWQRIEPLLP